MSALDGMRTQSEAQRGIGDVRRTNAYSEAVNRYLGAERYQPTPDIAPVPAPAAGRTKSGLVMVGVDDSPSSYIAVDHAGIEAELRGWGLRLVHVQQAGSRNRDRDRDRGARLLERMTDRVHACSPLVVVTSHLAVGAPAPTLLAEAGSADLVVVGHQHGLASAAFGLTVGDRVATQHPSAVLVVRVPGWPPGPQYATRPIVVGVDASPTSPRTIGFALREARLRGCDLFMVHAAEDGTAPMDRLETRDDVVVHHRTVIDDPITALVAASSQAGAIIVGRRSKGSVADALLGSVSRALLQRADCPVFLVG